MKKIAFTLMFVMLISCFSASSYADSNIQHNTEELIALAEKYGLEIDWDVIPDSNSLHFDTLEELDLFFEKSFSEIDYLKEQWGDTSDELIRVEFAPELPSNDFLSTARYNVYNGFYRFSWYAPLSGLGSLYTYKNIDVSYYYRYVSTGNMLTFDGTDGIVNPVGYYTGQTTADYYTTQGIVNYYDTYATKDSASIAIKGYWKLSASLAGFPVGFTKIEDWPEKHITLNGPTSHY